MTVKPCVGFIADVADDTIEDGGDITLFGGRNAAIAVGQVLARLGCRVAAPRYADEHGWELDLIYQDHTFWCQVTSFHPVYLLVFEDPAFWGITRRRNAAAYAGLLEKLAAALEADPRFHHTEWRSVKEGPPGPYEVGPNSADDHSFPHTVKAASLPIRAWNFLKGIPIFLLALVSFYLMILSIPAILIGVAGLIGCLIYREDPSAAAILLVGGSLVFWLTLGRYLWRRQRSASRSPLGAPRRATPTEAP